MQLRLFNQTKQTRNVLFQEEKAGGVLVRMGHVQGLVTAKSPLFLVWLATVILCVSELQTTTVVQGLVSPAAVKRHFHHHHQSAPSFITIISASYKQTYPVERTLKLGMQQGHDALTPLSPQQTTPVHWIHAATLRLVGACLVFSIVAMVAVVPAFAADYAKKNLSGQDFSGQDLAGLDFTSVVAKNTNFHDCNLRGSIFSKADLQGADFSGANIQEANFVDAKLDGTNFANALGQKATFSASILDVGNFENVDLTDSLWPSTYLV